MVQTRGKNNRKFKFFIAAYAFKKMFGLFQFFEFLDALMPWKSQVGVVFHHFWLFGQFRAIQITVLCTGHLGVIYQYIWLTHNYIFFYRLPLPGEVDRLFWVTYYFRILLLFIIMNLLLTTKSIKLEMELLWHQRQSKHLKTYSNVITLI